MPAGDAAKSVRGIAAADARVPGLALFYAGFRATRSRQGRRQRRGDARAAAPRIARSWIALVSGPARLGRTSMYRLDRRHFMIGGIALVGAGPARAQHAGHG